MYSQFLAVWPLSVLCTTALFVSKSVQTCLILFFSALTDEHFYMNWYTMHFNILFQSPTCTSSWWKGERWSRGLPVGAMPSVVKACWLKNHLGRYARWTGPTGTLKSWPTQEAGCWKGIPGRRRSHHGSNGSLIRPVEDWSPPGLCNLWNWLWCRTILRIIVTA